MKKLIILDLEKNYNFTIESEYYLLVNRGSVNTNKAKRIQFNLNKKINNLNKDKKNLFNFFNRLKKNIEKKINFQANELEIFNLRNDKYGYLDKILFFYILKKKKLFQKFKIEILTDKENLKAFYKSVFGLKTEITYMPQENRKKKIYPQLIFAFFRFILRVFYFCTLAKIYKRNYFLKEKDFYLSLFPYLFKNNDVGIYKKKSLNYLNFSLTDETHLNLKPQNFFKHIKDISKKKNFILIEKYISYNDIITTFFSYLVNFTKFYFCKNNYFFKGINCEALIREHLIYSYYNRYKLFVYKNSLKRFYEIQKPENLHYFLFEYNFGFFLRNQLKKIKRFIGYQHGIFTKNLMWLNALNKKEKKALPDFIYCNRKKSVPAYKIYFKKIILNEKKKFPLLRLNLSKKSNKILVFMGQHDMNDTISFFSNNSKFANKKIFFKLHPNNKKEIDYNFKNFFFIKKINFDFKYFVYLAPTTALIYDFMRYRKKYKIIEFDYKLNLWK